MSANQLVKIAEEIARMRHELSEKVPNKEVGDCKIDLPAGGYRAALRGGLRIIIAGTSKNVSSKVCRSAVMEGRAMTARGERLR